MLWILPTHRSYAFCSSPSPTAASSVIVIVTGRCVHVFCSSICTYMMSEAGCPQRRPDTICLCPSPTRTRELERQRQRQRNKQVCVVLHLFRRGAQPATCLCCNKFIDRPSSLPVNSIHKFSKFRKLFAGKIREISLGASEQRRVRVFFGARPEVGERDRVAEKSIALASFIDVLGVWHFTYIS